MKVKSEKNIGVLFKVSLHLIRHAYQYFSRLYEYKYVSYISYGNTAWVNTSQNKDKKILAKHQHVVRSSPNLDQYGCGIYKTG